LKDAVVVPVTAVRTAADGDFVWKLNPDRTVTRRKITRGPGTAETTSITAGLAVGEQVITEGGDRLTDGAHVTLPGDTRGQGGGGQAGGRPEAGAAPTAPTTSTTTTTTTTRRTRPAAAAGVPPAPANAQPGQGGPGGGGGGGFRSPEMQAARRAMMQACA